MARTSFVFLDAVCLDIRAIYRYFVGATFPSGCYFEAIAAALSLPWRHHTPFSSSLFQNRIEEAQTSDTLLETVGMTRSMDLSAEKDNSEETPAATESAKDIPVERKKATGSRYACLRCSCPVVVCFPE